MSIRLSQIRAGPFGVAFGHSTRKRCRRSSHYTDNIIVYNHCSIMVRTVAVPGNSERKCAHSMCLNRTKLPGCGIIPFLENRGLSVPHQLNKSANSRTRLSALKSTCFPALLQTACFAFTGFFSRRLSILSFKDQHSE